MNYWAAPGLKKEYSIRKEMSKQKADRIINYISIHYNTNEEVLIKPSRAPKLVEARQIIFYLLRLKTTLSLKAIGDRFHRDHTTIIHGIRHLHELMLFEPHTKNMVEFFESELT